METCKEQKKTIIAQQKVIEALNKMIERRYVECGKLMPLVTYEIGLN